jgi:hypothetical protein
MMLLDANAVGSRKLGRAQLREQFEVGNIQGPIALQNETPKLPVGDNALESPRLRAIRHTETEPMRRMAQFLGISEPP